MKWLVALLSCVTCTPAFTATETASGPGYTVRNFFTSALEDTLPVDRVDIVQAGAQVVMYTTYASLPDEEQTHVGKLFDAYGTLVHTYEHTFDPCGGTKRVWQWFTPPVTAPTGMWTFEVWLNGEKVLANAIFVGGALPSKEAPAEEVRKGEL
ncbi:MAG: hypothetical protein AAGA68_21680 [Pseudomonadota bacterium]